MQIDKQLATVCPNPFRFDHITHEWNPGESVADILLAVQPNKEMWGGAHVYLDDIEVFPEYYHVIKPKLGTLITIRVLPDGDGGLRSLAFIGLAAATIALTGPGGAFFVTGNTFATAAWAAGIYAVGSIAINALIPLDTIDQPEQDSISDSLSIGAARNRVDPFGVEPTVLGSYYVVPPMAARPYTSLQGSDAYVVMLFSLGLQPVEVNRDNIRIGNTLASSYDDVEIEILTGGSDDDAAITLYKNIVFEDVVNKLIPGGTESGYAEHTSAADTDSLIYEIAFPQGLVKYEHNTGDLKNRTVNVTVQYSTSAAPTTWLSVATHTFTAKSASPIRKGYTFTPPGRDQWNIRMRADVDNDAGEDSIVRYTKRFFSILRSLQDTNPVLDADVALVAMRIRATDQLQGIPDTVGMYCQSIVPSYGAATPWDDAISNNPADLIRWILTGPRNARALSTSRLHTQSFIDFWTHCDTEGFTYNQHIDSTTTIMQTMQNIARAGYGRVVQVDGLWRIIIDKAQTVPRQVFTPRNSWGFQANRVFPETVHGFRIRWINETEDPSSSTYINDEMIVYDDKYNATNATVFESIQAVGITNWDQVWRYGRRYLAVARLQPEAFTFSVDAEHLVTIVGDRVDLIQDALLVGLGASRVKSITSTTVTLDAEIQGDGVTSYSLQFRDKTNTITLVPIDTFTGSTTSATFTSTQTTLPAAAGDLCVFGESGAVTFPMLIKNIEPQADLSARLSCIPYNEAIYTSDTGTIPDYDPVITYPAGSAFPVFGLIVSDEYVMWRDASGVLQPRMVVTLLFETERRDVQSVIAQYREYNTTPSNAAEWISLPLLPGDVGTFTITEVTELQQIEVRARYQFNDGTSSVWGTYTDTDLGTPYHTVVGQTGLPPDVDNFTVTSQSDGTREYTWSYDVTTDIPPDLAGYVIRYADTDTYPTAPTWANMTALHTGLLNASPFEFNAPFSGDWWFSIKAVDQSGNYSENQKQTPIVTLGLPRLGDSLFYLDHYANGWLQASDPGATLTLCNVSDATGYLTGAFTQTWTSGSTWALGVTWGGTPASSGVILEHDTGTGSVYPIAFDDTVTSMRVVTTIMADSGGTYTYEYALNGGAYTTANYDKAAFEALTFSSVDTLGIRLEVANIPLSGVQNWILQGFAN